MNNHQTALFPHIDPEDSRLEYKTCELGVLPNDIWKTISAFANSEGGQIILGVDPSHNITGLTADQIDKLQQDIVSLCQGTFNYPISPEVQVIGKIINVYIPPSAAAVRPIYSRSRGLPNGAWVRVGSSTVQMSDEMRNQFAAAARGGSELIEYPNLKFTDCFNMDLVDKYISTVNASRNNVYLNHSVKEVLQKMRAINSKDEPTLFGLLAFSNNSILQEVTAPSTNVAVTEYAGNTKVNPNNPEITYLDDREFNGNIINQFETSFSFIRSKLPVTGIIDQDGKRRDYLTIPEVAIREALANALTHRDYGTFSSRIQVDIYSDRIEIINPGASLVPIEFIDTTPSMSRNPSLMSFLKDFHITEQRARGIRTIRESLRAAGLLEPLIENLPSSFRITLYNSAFISHEDHEWLQQFREYNLNEHQLTILSELRNSTGGISNAEYREKNHMTNVGDDRRANYELTRLVNLKIIDHDGVNRGRRYYLREEYK
jgi:ATP-dependent DNA helicase RecG